LVEERYTTHRQINNTIFSWFWLWSQCPFQFP